jgi:hypothetical protein
MRTFRTAVSVVVAVSAAALPCAARPSAGLATTPQHRATHCALPHFGPGREYRPHIDPHTFSARISNPWFPLPVGATFIYVGTKDGKTALDVMQVSSHTRRIDRVRTRVVNDRLFLAGRLAERTADYYAQDRCGDVWYFGEDTATIDAQGRVIDRSGSFHAGRHGAQPGVFMQRHPVIGRWFRQEWYRGQAEDRYRLLRRNAYVKTRYLRSHHALLTEERTRLEPGVIDHKYYVAGVGTVKETTVRGGAETDQLVDILR